MKTKIKSSLNKKHRSRFKRVLLIKNLKFQEIWTKVLWVKDIVRQLLMTRSQSQLLNKERDKRLRRMTFWNSLHNLLSRRASSARRLLTTINKCMLMFLPWDTSIQYLRWCFKTTQTIIVSKTLIEFHYLIDGVTDTSTSTIPLSLFFRILKIARLWQANMRLQSWQEKGSFLI